MVLGLVLTATIGGGCRALPDYTPGPNTREIRLEKHNKVVLQAQVISGLLGAHFEEKGPSGADYSRVEFHVGVGGKEPPHVIRLLREQLQALDTQLQRDDPTLVDLVFKDKGLHEALTALDEKAEKDDEEGSIRVRTVLYYSFHFGKKVRESVTDVEMEVQR